MVQLQALLFSIAGLNYLRFNSFMVQLQGMLQYKV